LRGRASRLPRHGPCSQPSPSTSDTYGHLT
jgi:hypothetical protein